MENSNIKGNVLNKKSIKQLYTASVSNLGLYGFAFDSYGLGHLLEELPNGQIAVSHEGYFIFRFEKGRVGGIIIIIPHINQG